VASAATRGRIFLERVLDTPNLLCREAACVSSLEPGKFPVKTRFRPIHDIVDIN
jgi:hypothetical protein